MIGGAENMLKIHAESLARRGHQVTIATLGPQSEIAEEAPINGVNIIRMPVRNIYWPLEKGKNKIQKIAWHLIDCYNPMHRNDLQQVIDRVQPQVVICESIAGWSPAIWKDIASLHLPVLQVVHDQSFLCGKGIMFKNGQRCLKPCRECKLLRLGYRYASRYVSRFIFVSHYQQQFYHDCHFSSVASSVVYNAEPLSLEKKSELGNPKKAMRLGILGTLTLHKGAHNLINAFKLLKGNFELYVGGNFCSEDFRNQTVQLIAGDPRVHLLGRVNADNFFRQIDLTVVPSLWLESFGLVAVESCAKQVPIIVSNFGGLTEIVREGINGLSCDTTNVETLAATIQKVYDDESLYRKLVEGTHASIAKFINVDRMAAEIEQLCQEVINR
jgi:glycosyltransferase involved in cell wall biosynthesis